MDNPQPKQIETRYADGYCEAYVFGDFTHFNDFIPMRQRIDRAIRKHTVRANS